MTFQETLQEMQRMQPIVAHIAPPPAISCDPFGEEPKPVKSRYLVRCYNASGINGVMYEREVWATSEKDAKDFLITNYRIGRSYWDHHVYAWKLS